MFQETSETGFVLSRLLTFVYSCG